MKKIRNTIGKKLLVCDLKREYSVVRAEVGRAARRVLESGWYILGKEVEAFEEEFSRYVGSSNAIGVASGTEALQLALAALSISRGDEVITAVNTAIPTAVAIRAAGARPVFIDADERTSNIDVRMIKKAITRKTKAIIPVHLYGNPCDMKEVSNIAERYGLAVVEDCAQSHGARYRGRHTGTFGDLGAFSFYPTKNLGCYGDGGMVVTDDKKLAGRLRLLRNYGQSSRYRCDAEGINSRLDEVQAAILREKLKLLDYFVGRRIAIAGLYRKLLKNISDVATFEKAGEAKHAFHLYVIKAKDREGLKSYLERSGIETQMHYPIPLHMQKAFRDLGYKKGDFPVAEKLAGEIMSLPIFPAMKDSEVRAVCRRIKEFYRG